MASFGVQIAQLFEGMEIPSKAGIVQILIDLYTCRGVW